MNGTSIQLTSWQSRSLGFRDRDCIFLFDLKMGYSSFHNPSSSEPVPAMELFCGRTNDFGATIDMSPIITMMSSHETEEEVDSVPSSSFIKL
mmetsp:Transcript_7967/g.13208  ORF Transcript_7967/g.13208 Transcript_7967/m.13208 type:complete len:92 (+) Transcript_7967:93-368(+)